MEVKFSAGITSRHSWPNGKPTRSEVLEDGRTRHLLEDGRTFTVAKEPQYVLHYLSTWVGAEPDDTYAVKISIAGLSEVAGFFEVWNYDIGQVRSYAFAKTVEVVHIQSGESFSGTDFEEALRSKLDGERPAT